MNKRKEKDNKIIGVLKRPADSKYLMLLKYTAPKNFKKIFSLVFSCNKKKIFLRITPDNIFLLGKDHLENITFNISIMGSNMSKYFAKEEIVISVDGEDLNNICNIIRGDSGHIKLYIKEKYGYNKLFIKLEEQEFKSNDRDCLLTTIADIDDDLLNIVDTEYDLSLKLNSNLYKKRLVSVKKQHDLCEIIYNTHVKFQYKKDNKNGISNSFKDNTKIGLKLYKDVFSLTTTFNIHHIVNVFRTIITKEFYMLVSEENGICLNFYLDPIEDDEVQNYGYKDTYYRGDGKNTIVVRIFLTKNL